MIRSVSLTLRAVNRNSPFSILKSHLVARAAVSTQTTKVRNDWTLEEIDDIWRKPLMDLIFQAASIHREFHDSSKVQKCQLLSIKTGGCSEDCSYCPQSSKYDTGVSGEKMLDVDYVLKVAKQAKDDGNTRFCMGAAWRQVTGKLQFAKILKMVKGIRDMNLEVCCTLGMITEDHAKSLKEAGLTAYNHNLDSSEEYYKEIITTRTYQDRLETLSNVRNAGITVCCGGIIGMGETELDRKKLLHTLATLPTHPESVPINSLVPVSGTPLGDKILEKKEDHNDRVWDIIRMIAVARILMPASMVRLSAGRLYFSPPEQTLCFLAGANSIFSGEKLLTTKNNEQDSDDQMFRVLGIEGLKPKMQALD